MTTKVVDSLIVSTYIKIRCRKLWHLIAQLQSVSCIVTAKQCVVPRKSKISQNEQALYSRAVVEKMEFTYLQLY